MIKTIFLIWTHPGSTQDKGWVGASLASITPHAFSMVINSELNPGIAQNHPDFQSLLEKNPELVAYRTLGLATDLDSVVFSTNIWSDFLQSHARMLSTLRAFGESTRVLKRMPPVRPIYFSRFLAREIQRRLAKKRANTAILEFTAQPRDPKSRFVLQTLHALATETTARFKTIVVSNSTNETVASETKRMIRMAQNHGAQSWLLSTDQQKPVQKQDTTQNRIVTVAPAPTVFKWREQFINALQKKDKNRTMAAPVQSNGLDSVPIPLFGFGFVARPFDF